MEKTDKIIEISDTAVEDGFSYLEFFEKQDIEYHFNKLHLDDSFFDSIKKWYQILKVDFNIDKLQILQTILSIKIIHKMESSLFSGVEAVPIIAIFLDPLLGEHIEKSGHQIEFFIDKFNLLFADDNIVEQFKKSFYAIEKLLYANNSIDIDKHNIITTALKKCKNFNFADSMITYGYMNRVADIICLDSVYILIGGNENVINRVLLKKQQKNAKLAIAKLTSLLPNFCFILPWSCLFSKNLKIREHFVDLLLKNYYLPETSKNIKQNIKAMYAKLKLCAASNFSYQSIRYSDNIKVDNHYNLNAFININMKIDCENYSTNQSANSRKIIY